MAKKFVMETIKTIIRVEARIHGKEVRDLHLHESSSIDTAADYNWKCNCSRRFGPIFRIQLFILQRLLLGEEQPNSHMERFQILQTQC